MTVVMPPMRPRIANLPRDRRGYIVPRFVLWLKDGRQAGRGEPGAVPDFRIMDAKFYVDAYRKKLCWICGEAMGRHKVFVIGPMCSINRVTLEPPSHRDCAEFAAQACPFLARPRMRRNDKGLEEILGGPVALHVAGEMIERNPGCCCLWETDDYHMVQVGGGGSGRLIRLGEPKRVDWWAEGRTATREEVMASIDSGYPILFDMAKREGEASIAALAKMRDVAARFLPAA